MKEKECILVSACLLGVNCRYNGIEKSNSDVLDFLQKSEELGIHLIPVCPEQLGGLPTPRHPSERRGDQVMNQQGDNVTEEYLRGAREALRIGEIFGCRHAILKERSPSCGSGEIYDGSFSKTLISGNGCTAELLLEHGYQVYGESRIQELIHDITSGLV